MIFMEYALHHIALKHVRLTWLSGISFVILFLFQHPNVQEPEMDAPHTKRYRKTKSLQDLIKFDILPESPLYVLHLWQFRSIKFTARHPSENSANLGVSLK